VDIQHLNSGIYFILPPDLPTDALLALARAALAGGVGMLQYREKSKHTRRMLEEVTRLLEHTRPAGVPLIVNDRVDVAMACSADGVHLGQEDMPVRAARGILGPEIIIGATTPDSATLHEAEAAGASYVAIGPAFASPTKPEKPVAGIDAIRRTVREATVPVCAIGGICAENLPVLVGEGVALYAVISGISAARDPETAARELVRIASGEQPIA
jgi:thiamine-phosphate pyrophosphorylase